MPQPLSKVLPNAGFQLGNAGDRPLERHPDLAVLALEALASWSNVENFMLHLFIELFGGNDSIASEMYLALESQSAKKAAICSAANVFLKDKLNEMNVLQAILAIMKTNEKDRNKLAHWIWGDSPLIPDALLLIDPRNTLNVELDLSEIFVYKAHDFYSIIKSNDHLCGIGLEFNFIIQGHPANWDGRLLNKLMAEPEIKKRMKLKTPNC